MRSLPIPDLTGVEALQLCASSIRDLGLKARLLQAEAVVESAEKAYRERGDDASLHVIQGTDDVGNVTGKEMERIYNGTFVKSVKTRSTYEKLKKACVNDICPLCGQGTVHQLDHYLPITSFPVFGLTAVNLVPACSDCNKYKLIHVPSTAEEQTIHPYFDAVDGERWLFGEVVESAPAAIKFIAEPPDFWDPVTAKRVKTHFRIYKLGALYATHAAVEISNIRYALKKMATMPDSAQRISQHLREQAESRAQIYNNSWQRATYVALADSEWFCAGGFNAT
jgi:hypothetical protein